MNNKNQMYGIVNQNGKLLMQEDFRSYCFTDKIELAIKFVAEENAQLKIRKLPMFKHLTVKKIK